MRALSAWSGLLAAALVATSPAWAGQERVVLESAGEEPRAPLRFRPRAGASALFMVELAQDLIGVRGEEQLHLVTWLRSEVQRVDPNGSAEFHTWLAGLNLSKPNRKELDEALSHTLGLEVRSLMDARGRTSSATLGMRGKAIERPPEIFRALLGDFTRNVIPLPEEAVGVGARWLVDDTTELLGATVRRQTRYQVLARTADTVELEVRFSMSAEGVAISGPLGGSAKLKRMTGEGSSRMQLQLAEVPGGELDVTLQLVLEPEEEESGRRARRQEISMKTRVQRTNEPIPFLRWRDGVPEELRCPEGTTPEEVPYEAPQRQTIAWRCARADGTPHGPVVGASYTGIREFVGEYREGRRSGTWQLWDRPVGEPSRLNYHEGQLHGRNEVRDRRSDQLEIGEWRNGLREGPFEIRDFTGRVIQQGPYVRGEKHGVWRFLGIEGYAEVEFRAGKEHGPFVVHEKSGKKQVLGTYQNGLRHGEWVSSRRDGSLERTVYREGKLWTGRQTAATPAEERQGPPAEGELRNGQRQGPWIEWSTGFRDEPKAQGRYVDGRREGLWRTWYTGGSRERVLESEGPWRRDAREGRWTFYDEEGRRVRVETWRAGVLEGPATLFHPNGKKKEEGRYRKGLQEGEWKQWDDDGKLQWKGRFAAGKPVGVWTVQHPSQRKPRTVTVKPDARCPPWTAPIEQPTARAPSTGCMDLGALKAEGAWSRFHETYGYLAEEGTFTKGLKEGPWKLYYPSGNLLARGAYRAGFKEGPWTYFHDAPGRILAEASYTEGRRSGQWRLFHPDGRPQAETRYTPGKLAPRGFDRERQPEGLLDVERMPLHSSITSEDTFPEQWMKPAGAPDDELAQEALHRVLHPNGKPRSEGSWETRVAVGVHRTWDEQGQELEVEDRDAKTLKVAARPGIPREERVQLVDTPLFLHRKWDAQGRLLWLAKTGDQELIRGDVKVWDEQGQPRWYLSVSRGALHGPFRLPGPQGQQPLTGRAMLNEILEVQPNPCPKGTHLSARLRDELRMRCETPDREHSALSLVWNADLTLRKWEQQPDNASPKKEDGAQEEERSGWRPNAPDEMDRYPDGRPRWEKVLQEDGRRRYRAWYPNGTLREEGSYRGERRDGVWRGFAASGARLWEGRYDEGRPSGVWQGWHEDGTRRSRHGFGPWDFARFWRRDGTLQKEKVERGRDQQEWWRWYTPQGELRAEGTLQQGTPIGPWRVARGQAVAWEERSYPEGERLEWRIPGPDGKSRLEAVTLGQGATGTWRLWDVQGLKEVTLRNQGAVHKRWVRAPQGVLISTPLPTEPEGAPSPEPPPWEGRIDEGDTPFMPEEE